MLPRASVPVVREEADLLDALDQMNAGGINRALVMDDGRLEGILSITDVVRLVSWKTAGHQCNASKSAPPRPTPVGTYRSVELQPANSGRATTPSGIPRLYCRRPVTRP
jgi:CBS domain